MNGDDNRLSTFDRWYGRLENAANFTAAAFIFLLMLFVVLELLVRKFLHTSIRGFLDVIELSMATFAFLGAAYCQRLGGHIRMDILVAQFSGRRMWITEAATTLLALVVIGILIKTSFDHFLRAYLIGDTTIDAELPTWPSKLLAPIGLAILWLRLLLQFLGYLRLIRIPGARPIAVPPVAGSHAAPVIEDGGSESSHGSA